MAEIKIKTTDGNNAVTLAGPASGADVTLKLPTAAGSADQYLKTDGSNGQLSFATVSAGTALTGSTNNTVCTVTGANAIAGEANLTFDGTHLGVGTSSPAVVSGGPGLVVHGTTAPRIRLTNSTTGEAGTDGSELSLDGTTKDLWIENREDAEIRFATNGTERLFLGNDGQPSFEVANSYMAIDKDNTGVIVEFRTGGSAKGNIGIGGSDVTYNETSDYRLKENVSAISDGITRVKQLKPSKFNWISDNTNTLIDGFLAHEVSSVVPNAITGTKDAVDSDDNPVHQMIAPSKMIPLLTAALKEAITKIETLETKVAALEAG